MISAKGIGTIHVVSLQPHNWHISYSVTARRQTIDSALCQSRQEINDVSDLLVISLEPPVKHHLHLMGTIYVEIINNLFFEFVPIFQKKSKKL